ncbi:Equilibrative nucleoside transporter 1, partial [Operophtera brumata]
MSAVVSGQSLGGIVAALAQIISLAFKISPQHSALIYFIIADVLVISSLVSLKIWVYAFSIFAVFAISQAVYPAVTRLENLFESTEVLYNIVRAAASVRR